MKFQTNEHFLCVNIYETECNSSCNMDLSALCIHLKAEFMIRACDNSAVAVQPNNIKIYFVVYFAQHCLVTSSY